MTICGKASKILQVLLLALLFACAHSQDKGKSNPRNKDLFKEEQRAGPSKLLVKAKEISKNAGQAVKGMRGDIMSRARYDEGYKSAAKIASLKKLPQEEVLKIIHRKDDAKIQEDKYLAKRAAQDAAKAAKHRAAAALKNQKLHPKKFEIVQAREGPPIKAKKNGPRPPVHHSPFPVPVVLKYTECDDAAIVDNPNIDPQTRLEVNKTLIYNAKIFATSQDLLAYMHIPKVGGSQFYGEVIESSSKAGLRWFPDPQFGDIKGHHSTQSPGCGPDNAIHCGFSEIDSCIRAGKSESKPDKCGKLLYVGLLRDPVERTLSEYFDGAKLFCSTPRIWPEKLCEVIKKNKTPDKFDPVLFREWLYHPMNIARNRQVKHLVASVQSPVETDHKQCLNVEPTRNLNYWHARYPAVPHKTMTSEDQINADMQLVIEAMDILRRRFWFLGFTEEFRESVNCFKRLTKTMEHETKSEDNNYFKRHASGASMFKDKIPNEIKVDIENANALDVKIHDWMYAFFKKACLHSP